MTDAPKTPTPTAQSSPTMTTQNTVPKPPVNVPSTTQPPKAVVSTDELIAKPLSLPEFDAQVKLLNPNLEKRWVNRVAMNGGRFAQMQFAGFRVAKPNVDVKVPDYMIRDNAVLYMDCILMVIDKKMYDAALKYNAERAVARTRRVDHAKAMDGALRGGVSEHRDMQGIALPPEVSRKLKMYVPGEKETEDMG